MVSVIVPIYKVEEFISRCVVSLMEQTLSDVEFIFVDDATPDNSMEILQSVIDRYPDRKSQCRILHHEQNKGLPAARNTGLEVALGEYIFHCDSDDYVEKDMLERLYDAVKKNDADIVWCDLYLSFNKNERYMKQPVYKTPVDALKGMLSGLMKFNVWNKLIRHSLYTDNKICFPSGYGMGEDMTIIRLFARAKKVVYVHEAFYHYVQQNSGAFCKTFSEKHLTDIRHNSSLVIEDLKQMFGNALDTELAFFKLDVKFPFLISDDSDRYALWKEWYPEANRYIMQNKRLSFRSRLVQWLAWKNQFWAVRLYYKLVYRLVYGVLYR